MKKWLVAGLALLLVVGCSSKNEEADNTVEEVVLPESPDGTMFRGEEWYDLVETVGVNREQYHSSILPYASIEEALANEQSAFNKDITNASRVVSLNGEWDFYYAENPFERLGSTWGVDWDTSGWDKMIVPGDITLVKNEDGSFKYESPRYVNMHYPWVEDENSIIQPYPTAPLNHNAVGHYQRTFVLDESMNNQEIFLRMEGANSAYYVFVNGNRVGYSEDSYTMHEFNLTPYLARNDEGDTVGVENTLSIMLYQYSLGSYLENQDLISTFGIFRDVYLVGKNEAEIRDIAITTNNAGDLNAVVNLRSLQLEQDASYKVQGLVYKTDTNQLVVNTQEVQVLLNKAGEFEDKLNDEGVNVELSMTVKNPSLWYFDDPELYTVVVVLKDEQGNIVDVGAQRTGFRDIELNDGYFTINDQYVLLKGVNRHEFALEEGRSLSKDTIIQDMQMLKAMNINALRTSHYPNQTITYDLADELGIMICDEANIESHYGALVGDLPSGYENWNYSVMDRTVSMYERDKNHPSIILWSLGNEATYSHNGTDLDVQYPMNGTYCFAQSTKWLLDKDPSRLRVYERDNRYNGSRENSMVDIYSSQYWSLDEVEHQLVSGKNMPYIHSEYAHSMGNALGNLNEYWDQIRNEKKAQGGFIWDFKDQAVLMGNEAFSDNLSEHSYLGYGGDWGDKISDMSYCGNGLLNADGSYTGKAAEVTHVYQNVNFYESDDGYIVKNEFESLDLSNFKIVYVIEPDTGAALYEGELKLSTPANSEEIVQIEIPELDENAFVTLDFYVQLKEDNLYADAGHIVAQTQFVLQKGSKKDYQDLLEKSDFEVSQNDSSIIVKNDMGEIEINGDTGELMKYEFAGSAVFEENPHVNYLRATIENDFFEGKSIYEESLKDAYKSVRISKEITSIDKKDKAVTVYMEGYLSDQKSFVSFLYTLYADGTLGIESSFVGTPTMPGEIPVVGFEMALSDDYQDIAYYGKGPWENYSDRNTGSYYGYYTSKVDRNVNTKYLRPQGTGYHSDAHFVGLLSDKKGVFITSPQMGFSASSYSNQQLEEAQHWYELEDTNKVYLNVDLIQRGLGNAICGPLPLDEYLIYKGTEYHQAMHIIPLMDLNDDLDFTLFNKYN